MNSATLLVNNLGVEVAYTRELTSREMEVLRRLARGNCNKLIARDLGIAEATVKVHVKSLLRKLRLLNRTQAAVWAVNNGFAGLPMRPLDAPAAVAA
jgi:two-component system, NarL family, nitrate/nitrite response regulator NarL